MAKYPAEVGPIGYVLDSYPKLSETFILNEILGVEAAGVDTNIFALGIASDPIFNPEVARVRGQVRYLAGPTSVEAVNSIATVKDLEGAARQGFECAVEFAGALLPYRQGPLLVQALSLADWSGAAGIRHLHAHFLAEAADVTYMAHLITGIPFSVTAHAKEIYRLPLNLPRIREIYQGSRAFITVCEANRSYLVEEILGEGSKVFRVYNGLPLDEFEPLLGRQVNKNLILGVGRLSEKKGWPVLIRACSDLRKQSVDFHCVIAGAGRQRAQLLELRALLGLEEHVDLPGPMRRSEVLELMSRATVLAAPCVISPDGNQDALPTVLLEALAIGLPVVSTPVGGIPEIVEDGREGLLVKQDDDKALAKALRSVLTDTDLRTRLSRAGPEKAARTFNQRTTIPALIRLFDPGLDVSDLNAVSTQ